MSLRQLLVGMEDNSSDRDYPSEKIEEMAEKYGYQQPTGFEPLKDWLRNLREKLTRKSD